MNTTTFELLYQEYVDAKQKIKDAEIQASRINDKLEKLRKDLEILCNCGKLTRVGDIELIEKVSNCYTGYDDDVHSHIEEWWVCSHCTNVFEAPRRDDVNFPRGFKKYVKVVHTWFSDRERCHGRVLELLKPSLDRKKAQEEQENRKRKLDEARRIVAEEEDNQIVDAMVMRVQTIHEPNEKEKEHLLEAADLMRLSRSTPGWHDRALAWRAADERLIANKK